MAAGIRKTNDFCWINVMTPEVGRARAFFGEVLGWSFGEMPGVPGGELIRVGGRTAGALMDLGAGAFPPGTPPAIGVLLKVEDADAGVEKVRALGGAAEEPMDVLENGRMAICTDPTGAVFGLWQARAAQGIDVDSHAHGAPGWFDLVTRGADRAVAFYTALFGWTVEERSPAPHMRYRLFKLDDRPVGGAMEMLETAEGVPPNWMVGVSVDDAHGTARRAAELGGEICMPVEEIPGVGNFGLLRSPQGVAFHIIEWKA